MGRGNRFPADFTTPYGCCQALGADDYDVVSTNGPRSFILLSAPTLALAVLACGTVCESSRSSHPISLSYKPAIAAAGRTERMCGLSVEWQVMFLAMNFKSVITRFLFELTQGEQNGPSGQPGEGVIPGVSLFLRRPASLACPERWIIGTNENRATRPFREDILYRPFRSSFCHPYRAEPYAGS